MSTKEGQPFDINPKWEQNPDQDNALTSFLRSQIGPNERYKSIRALSIAAKLNQNAVANIMERGRAEPETLMRLAGPLDVPPLYLYVLVGWLTFGPVRPREYPPLTPQETEFITLWRQVPTGCRIVVEAVLRESTREFTHTD